MGNSCCYVCPWKYAVIENATVGLIERWGAFESIAEPGCHTFGFGTRLAGRMSLRVEQLQVRCETKTLDNVFVHLVASVQYKRMRDKLFEAFYSLHDPKQQIVAYVNDVLRSSVPRIELDDVFVKKEELQRSVLQELEKAMEEYGYEIVQTLIVDIEPDVKVKRAMNDINAAQRTRIAANETGEAYKIQLVTHARGEAEAKYLSGVGVARQRQAIVDGLQESVVTFSDNVPGTSAREVVDMVMMTQYFDTMRDIGKVSQKTTLFVPNGPGNVKEIADQIRSGGFSMSHPDPMLPPRVDEMASAPYGRGTRDDMQQLMLHKTQ
eukprot:TRINITY_DN3331_c0_g1_i1.p1 TRINITY_DN3331_c0_g1~~TRINITY_DN3331_c0_g1_i1.p1  ORF type:complete len:322 (-),score=59.41 TRINITY_DN3331_c0_g1_i1:716-1681(-)